jgi:hypothetical protein
MPTLIAADTTLHGTRRDLPHLDHPVERIDDRDRSASDCCGSCTAISDEDVAVELHCELAELEIIEHGADTPPDQSLDLLRATSQAATARG